MSKKKVFVHLDSGRGYNRDLLKGIYAFNNKFTKWEIIFEPAYFLTSSKPRNGVSIIEAVRPDGCILESSENIAALKRRNIPVVKVNSVDKKRGVPFVKGNYEADGKIAAGYFQKKGYRNLAFFGIEGLHWSDARLRSFRSFAGKSGASFYSHLLSGSKQEVLSHNFDRLASWLNQLPKPVGILCCNDDFGQILINTCSIAGLKIPYEAAILGIDNDELICNLTYPNLSSISRNHMRTATAICETLDEMMKGRPPLNNIIPAEPVEVIERSSTDTIASIDPKVTEAINYIMNHLHLPLSVADVEKATNLTAKALNNRFAAVAGSSIHQEIRFRKLSRFKGLLKTNRTIKEIAFELGFQDITHVSRWFSHLEGISPVNWKKKYGA